MGRYAMRFINATASVRRMSKTKLIIAIVVIISICTGTAMASSGFNVKYVFCDDVEYRVFSVSDDPYEIVAKAGITLDENNQLVLDYFDKDIIVVAEPHNVLIYDNGELVTSINVAGTVATALTKAGITLKDGDELNYNEGVGITSDMQIKITRAFPVTVKVDGKELIVNTVGGTVESVLKKAGVFLGENDTVSKKLTKELKKEATITVKRIEYKTKTKTVKTDYKTKVEYDSSMYEEQKKVKVKGVKGKTKKEYKYTYVDGELTKTKLIKSEVIKEPVTEVIIRGTKVRPGGFTGAAVKSGKVISELTAPFEIPLNKNGRPVNYKKVITGKATAYCTGTITSTGARAMPGRVAVDPREIPYGTKMYIVSSDGRWNYGYCVASDTGGFIYNSSTVVDLYMHSYTDCRNFGRRNVDIYILEWG